MAESLFDQLKKTGLVNEQKAKQAQKTKAKAQFQQTKQSKAQVDAAPKASVDAAANALKEKAERARLLNRERQQQQAKRAAEAEVRQIIESNRLSGFEGPLTYYFADNHKVKTLNVNQKMHQRLVAAEVRIARLDGGYALIPAASADKVELRGVDALIPVPTPSADKLLTKEEQDYYAKYEVPDDLVG